MGLRVGREEPDVGDPRAARVADHVSKTHSLGPAQAAVETFTKGAQSYDTLRQSVLGAEEEARGAAGVKIPWYR